MGKLLWGPVPHWPCECTYQRPPLGEHTQAEGCHVVGMGCSAPEV